MARAVFAAVVVLACACAVGATTPAPVVSTTLGKVAGYVDNGVNVYLGIPFAAPPVGDLRFAPPQPAKPWSDIFNATATPPICAQSAIFDVVGVEDCLTLNVYVPTGGDTTDLPVMFWIYGGGWVEGNSYEKGKFSGVEMATEHNVIVVTVNYRLGIFGFLALPALVGSDGAVGNMGLLDQRMGMQWVQDNIKNFGGDTSHVAIFGESAGGFSVCFHLVSPGSKGLFHAAIMESGTCESHGFFVDTADAYAFSAAVANSVKCTGSSEDQLACLRALSVKDALHSNLTLGLTVEHHANYIMQHAAAVRAHMAKSTSTPGVLPPEMGPVMPWTATIDGTNLLAVPLQSLKANQWADVPVIFGTNKNEGTLFVPMLPIVVPGTDFPPSTADMAKALPHFFNHYTTNKTAVAEAVTNTIAKYPLSNYKNNKWYRAAAIMTDWFFTCATRRAATAIADNGGEVYVYQFTQKLPWLEYDLLGDYHGSEVWLVWGYSNFWHPYNSDVTALSGAMQYYWTSMAKQATPNAALSGEPLQWPAFNSTSLQSMDLSWPLSTVTGLHAELCDFWDETLSSFHH